MRVAAYYRVSSSQQRDAGTIASQRTAAHALVAARGWELVAEYEDDGRSAWAPGKLTKRAGFAQLLDLVRARGVEGVVCVAQDRLTRAEDLAEMGAILGALQAAGVKILGAGGEETDLSTFGGRLTATLRALLAAEESAVKSDRSKRGRARTAAAGRPPCAPPFGLAFDRERGNWTEASTADLVREIFRRAAGGESARQIAADLRARGVPRSRRGMWTASPVCRILWTDCYDSGRWAANKGTVIEVPRLIDPEVAGAARARLSGNQLRGWKRTQNVYLLEGIATCRGCATPVLIYATVTRRPSGAVYRYSYYTCHTKRHRLGPCDQPTLRTEAVDADLWERVSAWLAQPDLVQQAIGRLGGGEDGRHALADLAGWRARLDQLPALEVEALRARERGQLSSAALEMRLSDLSRRRALLEKQIAAAEEMHRSAAARVRAAADLEATIAKLREGAEKASPEQRREIVRGVCQGLQLGPNGAEGEIAVGVVVATLRVAGIS